jgi:anaerobic ribonucleoside-triphosphate reductase activating protein
MNYHDITKADMLNGSGLRVVLWVAGCSHHCKGCQNPQTWDENSGILFDKQAEDELFEALKPDYISGITFSGGDPLYIANRAEVTRLAKKCKELYPNKTTWLYTGFLWQEVKHLEIMEYIDILIDGKFVENLKDNRLYWRGSLNQSVIDVKTGKIILYEDN